MTPDEVNKRLPGLSERLAAQLDEATRKDLHDFLVALACNDNVEETGMWLFALRRAMKPLTESGSE
jgi:hypothetical protein